MSLLGLLILTASAEPVSLRSGAAFVHQGLTLRAWSTAEGLPQATVEEIVQTDDGFLWLATYGGLARFDGQRFRTYETSTTDGSYTLRISGLTAATGGALWVGLERGGVLRFDGERFRRPPGQPEALEDAAVMKVIPDGDDLWLATSAGVMARRGGAWRTLESSGFDVALPFVVDMTRCDDGSLWAATFSGTGRVDGDRLVRVGERSESVLCVDDTLYVGTERGVQTWDGHELAPSAELGETSALAIGPDGALWAGGDGFVARLGQAPRRWAVQGEVIDLSPDREGNLWAGTRSSGLVRLSEQPFQRLSDFLEGSYSPGPVVADGDALLVRRNALPALRLWREDGRWRRAPLDPGQQAAYERAEADPELDFVDSVALAADRGEVALATREAAWRLGAPAALTLEGEPRVLRYDRDGALWVGTMRGGAYRLEGGASRRLTTADGLLEDGVINIVPAPDGALWFTHESGVSVLRGDTLRTLGRADGVPPGQVRAVWFDPEGRAWLGTYGGGLGLVEGDRVRRFTTAHGLYDNVVSAILADDQGGVWMNGNRGVFRVRYDELRDLADGALAQVQSWPLPTGEGNGVYQPAAAALPDGQLAFAMVDGIVLVDPGRVSTRQVQPLIHVEGLTADGAPVTDGQIRPGAGEVTVTYTSPSLTWPSLVRYQTRLVRRGDEPWSAPSTDRQVRFLGLEPGTYTLEVRAINERGQASAAPASVTFTQRPFWWQTRPAALLFGLALVGAGGLLGAAGWRLERRHARALQDQIDQRERAEAEQEALSQQLARAQRLEAVGRLAGGIAHDFNNLLTVVLTNADLLKAQIPTPTADTAESLEGIQDASMRASELVQQLLAFSRQQVLKPRRYDLNHSLRALEPMLRRFVHQRIDFSLELLDEPLPVFADPNQLDLVLVNLCINAVDAMPEGGALRLTLRRGDDTALIAVSDTGAGIPEADLPKIFDPFFTTKPVGEGTGLGLSSALGIVTQSGGDIQVQSRVGEGTTFLIQLPLVG